MTYKNNAKDTAVQAGWSLGDYGIITDNDEGCGHGFEAGDVVQLAGLDGSSSPLFVRLYDRHTQYVDIEDGVVRVSTSLPRVFYTRCSQSERTRLKKSPALQSLGKWLGGQDFADSDIGCDEGWLQFDGKVWHGTSGVKPYPDAGAVAIDLEELEDWAAVVDAQAEYSSAYPAKPKIKEEEELKTPAEELGLKVGSKVVAGSPRDDDEVRVGDVLELVRDDGTLTLKFLIKRTGLHRYYALRDTHPHKPAPEVLTPAAAAGIFVGTECMYVSATPRWGVHAGDVVILRRDDTSYMPNFEVPLPHGTLYLPLNAIKPKAECSPAELGGYVKGVRCVVIEKDGAFEQGTIVTLARDDGSECPQFESVDNPEDQCYLVLGVDVVLERLYEAPEVPEVVKVDATPCQAQGIVQGAVCFLKEDYVGVIGNTVLKRGDVVVVTVDDGTQRPHCKVLVNANGAERTVYPYMHLLQPTGLILEQYAAKK